MGLYIHIITARLFIYTALLLKYSFFFQVQTEVPGSPVFVMKLAKKYVSFKTFNLLSFFRHEINLPF